MEYKAIYKLCLQKQAVQIAALTEVEEGRFQRRSIVSFLRQ
jgi:hypothetical protein